MKCKIFHGLVHTVEDAFNEWAKGKALTKGCLIGTVSFPASVTHPEGGIAILVFHPEDPEYGKTDSYPYSEETRRRRDKLEKALGRTPP